MARKDKLIERYNKLRAAGFSSKDATKLKYRSDKNVDKAIKEYQREVKRQETNAQRRANYAALRNAGYTPQQASKLRSTSLKNLENLLRDFQYVKPEGTTKNYLSKYTYLVKYQTKDKDKNITEKFIHITSQRKLSRAEVWDEIYDIFEDADNESAYEGSTLIRGSITIVQAYENV